MNRMECMLYTRYKDDIHVVVRTADLDPKDLNEGA